MAESLDFERVNRPRVQTADAKALSHMLDAASAQAIDLHSFLLARNGLLLAEVYVHPYHAEFLHDVRSVAKSVMSLLVGMALDDGYLKSIDTPMLSFFRGRSFANPDPRKEALTLRHLLSMASGIALSDSDTGAMASSPDWVQFVLDAPMAAAPGTVFNYSTSNAHVLSAIVGAATGMSTFDYARRRLFDPLSIHDFRWMRDPHGNPAGGMGLSLRPRDMLKIGQLVLDGGVWNGARLVSKSWLSQSTRSDSGNYGLLWWTGPGEAPGAYSAAGYGGQLIYVRPEERAVAVFTAGTGGPPFPIEQLFLDHVVPALKGGEDAAEPAAWADFAARAEELARPHPTPILPNPPLAAKISGRRYVMAENWMGWDALTFSFDGEAARLAFDLGMLRVEMPISLDGVLRGTLVERLGPLADGDTLALSGHWADERTLSLGFHILGCPEHWLLVFTFDGEGESLSLAMRDMLSGHTRVFAAQAS
jgi:CubicO group peptidase (beta-lactamase class C family)